MGSRRGPHRKLYTLPGTATTGAPFIVGADQMASKQPHFRWHPGTFGVFQNGFEYYFFWGYFKTVLLPVASGRVEADQLASFPETMLIRALNWMPSDPPLYFMIFPKYSCTPPILIRWIIK